MKACSASRRSRASRAITRSTRRRSRPAPIALRNWQAWASPRSPRGQGGREVKIGRFPYQANGKAIALSETEGLVKTISDAETGELLGAHMIGAEVTGLIQGFVIAKRLETTEVELISAIFPHPTLSEMMHESVLEAYGRALHI
jgi:Pyridine nucleotide-disulphide oxidoreductase, dimerisation domain